MLFYIKIYFKTFDSNYKVLIQLQKEQLDEVIKYTKNSIEKQSSK